jgi:hypothetical protein
MRAMPRFLWVWPLITLACANVRAVKDHELTVSVPSGFVQAFRAEVPLHPTLPTRVLISFAARCRPDFSMSVAHGQVRHATTLFRQPDPDPEWQAMLKRRLAEHPAQTPPGGVESFPATPVAGEANPPAGAQALRATAPGLVVTVELPPRAPDSPPPAGPSFEQRFEAKRAAICGSEVTWLWESSLFEPKVSQTVLELATTVPQWVEGASLRFVVERLEHPASPQEAAPGQPPVPGAKWIPGQWIWKPEGEWVGNWGWFPGWWQRPSR